MEGVGWRLNALGLGVGGHGEDVSAENQYFVRGLADWVDEEEEIEGFGVIFVKKWGCAGRLCLN